MLWEAEAGEDYNISKMFYPTPGSFYRAFGNFYDKSSWKGEIQDLDLNKKFHFEI